MSGKTSADKTVLGLAFALVFAAGAGFGAVGLTGAFVERDATAAEATVVTAAASALPTLEAWAPAMVVPAAEERVVPADVLATADAHLPASAPGLALVAARLEGPWEERRAEIRDEQSGDVRAYAIGDLLPHGALLVGIDDAGAEVMIGDRALVRLVAGGAVEPVNDFPLARGARGVLGPAPAGRSAGPKKEEPTGAVIRVVSEETMERHHQDVRGSLEQLGSADPAEVQAAIDALVGAGDPAVELLIPHAGSLAPVAREAFAFPSASGPQRTPRVRGDVVIAILERITGQTFGDPTASELAPEQRDEIGRAWQRWWGLE